MIYTQTDPEDTFRRAFEGQCKPLTHEQPPSAPVAVDESDALPADASVQSKQLFLENVTNSVLGRGTGYTSHKLRQMGLHPAEIRQIMDAVAAGLRERGRVDVETHRAVSVARHEEIFYLAKHSLDLQSALGALRQIDRVTGVTRHDGDGDAGGSLTDLGKLIDVEAHVERQGGVDELPDHLPAFVPDEPPPHPDEL